MLAVPVIDRASARALSDVQRDISALRDEDAPWAAALADLLDAGALAAREDARAPAAFAAAACAFDVAGRQIVPLFDLLVEPFQHAPGLLAAAA